MKELSVILVFVALAFFVVKKSVSKAFKPIAYKLLNFSFGKPAKHLYPLTFDIELYNPNPVDAHIKNYKVELYQKSTSKLLSTSNIINLTLPAKGKVINKALFTVNAFQLIAISGSKISIDGMASDINKQLEKNIVLKVHATIDNEITVKEIKL